MTTEQLPDGLELAVALLAQIGDESSDAAIAAVHDLADAHAQRVTLLHHAADQVQRIADLEAENSKFRTWLAESNERAEDFAGRVLKLDDENENLMAERDWYEAAYREWVPASEFAQSLCRSGALPISDLGRHCGDALIDHVKRLTAERDELRAKLAEIEGQEPVAWDVTFHENPRREGLKVLARQENGRDAAPRDYAVTGAYSSYPLYARPVPAIPDGWRLAPKKLTPEMRAEVKPGEWIEWRGGACPIASYVRHQVRMRDGWESIPDTGADGWMGWTHNGSHSDIVAYRVLP